MGGNGDIGGGSCKIRFKVEGKPEKTEDDNAVGESFDVMVTFPDKTARVVTVGKNEKIRFDWPWPPETPKE